MTDIPGRADVWWCETDEIGRRPVAALSRDAVIPRQRRALIAPCTTTIRNQPSEVLLEPGEDQLPLGSAANLGLGRERLDRDPRRTPGRLADDRTRKICDALAVVVDGSE